MENDGIPPDNVPDVNRWDLQSFLDLDGPEPQAVELPPFHDFAAQNLYQLPDISGLNIPEDDGIPVFRPVAPVQQQLPPPSQAPLGLDDFGVGDLEAYLQRLPLGEPENEDHGQHPPTALLAPARSSPGVVRAPSPASASAPPPPPPPPNQAPRGPTHAHAAPPPLAQAFPPRMTINNDNNMQAAVTQLHPEMEGAAMGPSVPQAGASLTDGQVLNSARLAVAQLRAADPPRLEITHRPPPQYANLRDHLVGTREEILKDMLGLSFISNIRDPKVARDMDHATALYENFAHNEVMHCSPDCDPSTDALICCWHAKFLDIGCETNIKRQFEKYLLLYQVDITAYAMNILKSRPKITITLPYHCEKIINEWIESNKARPYPGKNEYLVLEKRTGLTIRQIKYTFKKKRAERNDLILREPKGGNPLFPSKRLKKRDVKILNHWIDNIGGNPYPNGPQKVALSMRTGLRIEQINSWMRHYRDRHPETRFTPKQARDNYKAGQFLDPSNIYTGPQGLSQTTGEGDDDDDDESGDEGTSILQENDEKVGDIETKQQNPKHDIPFFDRFDPADYARDDETTEDLVKEIQQEAIEISTKGGFIPPHYTINDMPMSEIIKKIEGNKQPNFNPGDYVSDDTPFSEIAERLHKLNKKIEKLKNTNPREYALAMGFEFEGGTHDNEAGPSSAHQGGGSSSRAHQAGGSSSMAHQDGGSTLIQSQTQQEVIANTTNEIAEIQEDVLKATRLAVAALEDRQSSQKIDEDQLVIGLNGRFGPQYLPTSHPNVDHIKDSHERVQTLVKEMAGRTNNEFINSKAQDEIILIGDIYQAFVNKAPIHCYKTCDQNNDPRQCCWNMKFQALEAAHIESTPQQRFDAIAREIDIDTVKFTCKFINDTGRKLYRRPLFACMILNDWAYQNKESLRVTPEAFEVLHNATGFPLEQIRQYMKSFHDNQWEGKQRKKDPIVQFSDEKRAILINWFENHKTNPYLDKNELEALVIASGLTDVQVRNWISKRRQQEAAKSKKQEHQENFNKDLGS